MKSELKEKVRHPISIKIFSITVLLLAIMTLVTYTSTSHLKQLNSQLAILTEYYIPLDQAMSDVRNNHLSQVLNFERLQDIPQQASFDTARAAAQKYAKEKVECDRDKYRESMRQAREIFSEHGIKEIASYELVRFCADKQVAMALALTEKALALPSVLANPDQIQKFTRLQSELKSLPEDRAAMHGSIIKYLAELRHKDARTIAILMEQVDADRKAAGRGTSNVGKLLHTYTQETADKASALERNAFLFTWTITLAAGVLGLIFSVLLTRNLVRPVRQLLDGAKAIGQGDLDIKIHVKSEDEIALLARSFNNMAIGLREKEAIRATFSKYMDPRIVTNLLEKNPLTQSGERKAMTVFFSDIENFTVICEQLTPNSVVQLLNHYFSAMSEPIQKSQGIIDKYIGDSIMAFWGPPFIPENEHAILACYAALDQLAKLENFRKTIPEIIGLRKGLPTFNVRVGISTGDVTVGTIGSELTKSYTVVGDTVNLASRLESANKYFGTHLMISEETKKLASAAVETRELDMICVVGKSEPVRVFELMGRKGEVDQVMLQLRDLFEQGLQLYRSRQWSSAVEAFEKCLQLKHDDAPAKLYLSRLLHFQQHEPASDWDGTWSLTEK
jgi:adenylate cyclase